MLTFLTHRSAFDVTKCRKPVRYRDVSTYWCQLNNWSGECRVATRGADDLPTSRSNAVLERSGTWVGSDLAYAFDRRHGHSSLVVGSSKRGYDGDPPN